MFWVHLKTCVFWLRNSSWTSRVMFTALLLRAMVFCTFCGHFLRAMVFLCFLWATILFYFLACAAGQSLVDKFQGKTLRWKHNVQKVQGDSIRGRGSQEVSERSYTLKIHKRDRDCIIPHYIDHVNARAILYKHQNRYSFSLLRNWQKRFETILMLL